MSQSQLLEFTPFLNREIIELNNSLKKIKNPEDIEDIKTKYFETKSKEVFEKNYDENSKKLGSKNLFLYLKSKLNDNGREISMYKLIQKMLYSNEFNFDEVTDLKLRQTLQKELIGFKNTYFNMPQGYERERTIKLIKKSFDFLNINDNYNAKSFVSIPKNIDSEIEVQARKILNDFKDIKEKILNDGLKEKKYLKYRKLNSSLFTSINFFNNKDIYKESLEVFKNILTLKSAFPDYDLRTNLKLRQQIAFLFSKVNLIGEEFSESKFNKKVDNFINGLDNIFKYSNTFKNKEILTKMKDIYEININETISNSQSFVKELIHINGITYKNLLPNDKNSLNALYLDSERKKIHFSKIKSEIRLRELQANKEDIESRSFSQIFKTQLLEECEKRINSNNFKIKELKNSTPKEFIRLNTIEYIFKTIKNNFPFLQDIIKEKNNDFLELLQSTNLIDFSSNELGEKIIESNIKLLNKKLDVIIKDIGIKFDKINFVPDKINQQITKEKEIFSFMKNSASPLSIVNRKENQYSKKNVKEFKEILLELELSSVLTRDKSHSENIVSKNEEMRSEIKNSLRSETRREQKDERKIKYLNILIDEIDKTNTSILDISKNQDINHKDKLIEKITSNIKELNFEESFKEEIKLNF